MQITVLGAGTIGLSWVRRFVAGGHTVTVCDPRPDLADVLATLPLTDSERGRVRIETDRAAALAAADLVQESGPNTCRSSANCSPTSPNTADPRRCGSPPPRRCSPPT